MTKILIALFVLMGTLFSFTNGYDLTKADKTLINQSVQDFEAKIKKAGESKRSYYIGTLNEVFVNNNSSSQKKAIYQEIIFKLGNIDLEKRYSNLKYGLGIGDWFKSPRDKKQSYFDNYISQKDIDLFKKIGIKHIRLPIHPTYLKDEKIFKSLINATNLFVKNKIPVIIDFHDENANVDMNTAYIDEITKLWDKTSKQLSKFDSNYVYFEVLNEPSFENRDAQREPIQKNIVQKIRTNAPLNTIIVTGPAWGSIDGLMKIKPLEDKNTIYTFHFYNPDLFTSQGAERNDLYVNIKNLPYPFSYDKCKELLKGVDPTSKKWTDLNRYCDQKDGTKQGLYSKLDTIVSRAKKNNVKIYMGEFGVYNTYVQRNYMLNRYKDIKEYLNKHDIGRSLWAYTYCYGLAAQKDANYNITSYDKDIAKIIYN